MRRLLTWGAFLAVGFVLSGAAFLLFFHLGAEPLQDYDEATYAEVSAESIAAHQYFTLTFLHHNFFRKPPAIFWAMDISEALITNPEVGARLPSALSAFVLVALLIWMVFDATGNWYAGAAAGAILATTSAFIEPARQARLDILVSLFIVASVYAFWKAVQEREGGERAPRAEGARGWYLVFGILLGLAVLTKGPLAVYAVVPVLTIALVYKTYKWLFDPYFWGGVLLFFIVVLPWHVFETMRFGMAFWNEYLDDQILDRVGQTLFNGPTNGEYFGYLLTFALPWIILFGASVVALVMLWKKLPTKARALSSASVAGVVIVLLTCLLSKTKAITYLIPLYPFMALVTALMGYEIVRRLRSKPFWVLCVLLFVALAAVAFELSIYNGFHINPYYSTEVSLAQNEKTIAEAINAQAPPTFYAYDTTNLGDIMFYTKQTDPLGFTLGEQVPPHSLVVFPATDLPNFQVAYPKVLTLLVAGTSLDLARLP